MSTRIIPGRVAEGTLSAEGIIVLKVLDEDPGLYNSNAIGDPVDRTGFPGQSVTPIGSTHFFPLDIPLLGDVDDDPLGMYTAARGVLDSWTAYALYRKETPTSQFEMLFSFDGEAAMGNTRTLLGVGPTTVWDYDNTVDVELIGGELESMSEDEALAGNVAYLIGSEIVLCQAVTQLSENTWRLAGPLVRGWAGTEWAVGTHTARLEKFVRLNLATIRRATVPFSDLNESRFYKPVTAGQTLEDAQQQTFINTGVSLMPWSPVDIEGAFDGDDIDITWRRRSRLRGNNGRDFYDPPLGEETESYEVDILSDDESEVLRTLTSTTPTATYLEADQITDFGGAKETNLHVNVYQMSASVGRGYPGHAILNPIGDDGLGTFGFLYQDSNQLLFEDDEPFEFEH